MTPAFLADKLNLLRIFEEALRTGYLIHPDAMRAVSANLDLIDDDMRNDPEAHRIFLDLMLKHGNPERALRRMNELGVLAAFLPEFAPIVAMMQFNMYHHYTVDEHTIQCIKTLAQIERGELVEELPVASSILKGGVNRKVLYVALLLHDIGKGRPEDHSIVGARIARTVCPRLGLKPAECETVEWLVRYHLLMSDMAQKRDIADPRTVRDFAKAVKTREAARPADGADRLRHPRRRPRGLEQLEGPAAAQPLPRDLRPRWKPGSRTSTAKAARTRPSAAARGAGRLAKSRRSAPRSRATTAPTGRACPARPMWSLPAS